MSKQIIFFIALFSIIVQGFGFNLNPNAAQTNLPINKLEYMPVRTIMVREPMNFSPSNFVAIKKQGNLFVLDSAYLLRFEVTNASSRAGEWVFDLGSLSYASVYLVNHRGEIEAKHAGRMIACNKKSDPEVGNEIVRFWLSGNESKTVYLYVKIVNPTMKLKEITILSKYFYEKQVRNNYLKYGLYFGFLVLLLVSCVLLSIFLKLRIYLIFAIFVFFASTFVGYLFNVFALYWFPTWPNQSLLFEIAFIICFIAISVMIRFFLEQSRAPKRFFVAQSVWQYFAIACIVALSFIAVFCSESTFFIIQDVLSTINLIITVSFLLVVFNIRNTALLFFIVGIMITALGGLVLQFSKFFITFDVDALMICSSVEVVLVAFSFAIAYRDADKMQKRAIQQLVDKLQNQEIELKESNTYLEQRVQDRTVSLEKQYVELKSLNALKNRFFSIIGHDLKNPIGTVIGFADLLIQNIDHYEIEKTKQFLKHIHTSSSHTFQLLVNLLEWAHSQTNEIKYLPTMVNMCELLNNSINIVQSTADTKEIAIRAHCHPAQTALLDANMMQTILRNLLSNAIKFSMPGSVIDVTASVASKVVFKVTDHGVGMTSEQIGHLFHINTNRSTPGTSQETGTGLGLIITHEFVQRMNGEIAVESTPGHGTTFTIIIPAGLV